MFFVGLIVGIGIGAVWMVGARIVVKMRQDNKAGTPSASHNSAIPKLPNYKEICSAINTKFPHSKSMPQSYWVGVRTCFEISRQLRQ